MELFRRLSSSPALTASTDTPLQVALENEETHAVQTLPCGSQLRQDINAIATVLDRALEAPDLPLGFSQSL